MTGCEAEADWTVQLGGAQCPVCGEDFGWEQPDCLDGHGADCPERFCVRCGLAVWGGVVAQDRRAG